MLALHLRLQPIHLHLPALALRLRLLDLLLQPLDFPLDEVEAAFDGHDGFAAFLLQQDGPDELVDVGGGGEGGEFLGWGRVVLVCLVWLDGEVWGGSKCQRERERDPLDAFVFLLLGFEALAGGDGCLEV